VQGILAELPETLDETYERILREIPKTNRVHAHRLLQCLTVAVRPLEVEELAEVLAIDFDAAGGIPKLNEGFRWANQEQAVLSACSSLVVIVKDRGSRRVQFFHYSVKEFLTSDRLAASAVDVLRDHHIHLEPAHTIMAKACLGVLLQLNDHMDKETIESYPLAKYAGKCLTDHAEFGNVLFHINDGLGDLLDPDKPHFNTWFWLQDGDWVDEDSHSLYSSSDSGSSSHPLYSSSDSGSSSGSNSRSDDQSNFQRPVPKYPPRVCPLYYTVVLEHWCIAERLILKRPLDFDAGDIYGMTTLHLVMATQEFWPRCYKLAQMLIERTAAINGRDKEGWTPLHYAMRDDDHDPHHDFLHCLRLLLDRGANVEAQSNNGSTPLHLAASRMGQETIQLLIENRVNIDLRNNKGRTALHKASKRGHLDIVRLLLDHGADLNLQDNHGSTPLHLATHRECQEVVQLFLEHGANVTLRNDKGQTALHQASQRGHVDIIQLILKHDADVDALDNDGSTPLHLAIFEGSQASSEVRLASSEVSLASSAAIYEVQGSLEVVQLLLEHGANTNLRNHMGQTALHIASQCGHLRIMVLILNHNADVNALDDDGSTLLRLAISEARLKGSTTDTQAWRKGPYAEQPG
jgi:ankyrin repeat protein